MLPALKESIDHGLSGDWNLAHLTMVAAHKRAIKDNKYFDISQDVLGAFAIVNRLAFLKPLWEQIDRGEFSFSENDIVYLVQGALTGKQVLIWYDGKEFLNSTSVYVTMRMVEAGVSPDPSLRRRALVIGSGSGYVPALFETMQFEHIDGVEINPELVETSRVTLQRLRFARAQIHEANGLAWIADQGEFDTILVFAAVESEDVVGELRQHLSIGGNLVLPIGPPDPCELTHITRVGGVSMEYSSCKLEDVMFTPFIAPAQ